LSPSRREAQADRLFSEWSPAQAEALNPWFGAFVLDGEDWLFFRACAFFYGVIPAQAGIHSWNMAAWTRRMDSRLRGNDVVKYSKSCWDLPLMGRSA